MRAAAILLAAGRGERLGGGVPKAFHVVGGTTVLARAVRTVERVREVEGVVVTAPPGFEEEAEAAVAGVAGLLAVVPGGESRQASVRAALAAVPSSFDAVVCHDVARPFASAALYRAVLRGLTGADGAVPVVPVTDTVKRLAGERVLETISRDELGLAQTPQAFRREALERAHERAALDGAVATDDAMLLERLGMDVVAVPGDAANLKLTSRADLRRAEELARAEGHR